MSPATEFLFEFHVEETRARYRVELRPGAGHHA